MINHANVHDIEDQFQPCFLSQTYPHWHKGLCTLKVICETGMDARGGD